jgi:1-acyl-sn-glycerol-3-phosphate acyltransferase
MDFVFMWGREMSNVWFVVKKELFRKEIFSKLPIQRNIALVKRKSKSLEREILTGKDKLVKIECKSRNVIRKDRQVVQI